MQRPEHTLISAILTSDKTSGSTECGFFTHLQLLKEHGVAYYAAHELLTSGTVCEQGRPEIENLLSEARGTHVLYSNTLQKHLKILDSRSIRYILLKGASLWPVYPEEYLRNQEDIDILVAPADLEMAAGIFASEGYNPEQIEKTLHHISMTSEDPSVPDIEIHTRISPPGKGNLTTEDLFKHSVKTEILGETVSILSPEHLLIHILLHAANHHIVSRLRYLLDVKLLIAHQNDHLYTDLLSKTNGFTRRACGTVLRYCGYLFNTPPEKDLIGKFPVSSLLLKAIKSIIPSDSFIDNPVRKSRKRQILYNLLMIQNPFTIIKLAKGKKELKKDHVQE